MKSLAFSLLVTLSCYGFFNHAQAGDKDSKTPDYIRFQKSDDGVKPDLLQTAISTFTKDDHSIDLVAVVHLGDATYFEELGKLLAAYDSVLYEMVGGPYTKEKANQKEKAEGEMAQIQGLQQMAKDMFNLEFQLDRLDYLAGNFIHADMTIDEYMKHSGGKGISDVMSRAMKMAQTGNMKGMPTTEAESNQMMFNMLGAFMSGDSNALKRVMAPMLANAEALIVQLEGDEESVLIGKRNQRVIEVIDLVKRERGATGKPSHDAVLYGAGHMPGIEQELLEQGYSKTTTQWKTGWNIPQGPAKGGKGPDLKKMMEHLGEMMENANKGK